MNNRFKKTLGNIPYTAEVYWWLRRTGKPPVSGYMLDPLKTYLPRWVDQALSLRQPSKGKTIFIFTMLPYWVEQTIMLALSLAALGYDVSLGYLPYAHWKKPVQRFDARRQNAYMREVLKPLSSMVNLIPLLDAAQTALPEALRTKLPAATYRDVQYSLLREEVDADSELYQLRMKRNQSHAGAMLKLLESQQPDVVIVPNGSMLEFGITFDVARLLGIQTITYEFGEQSERVWMAHNDDVMRQDTSEMWQACKTIPLSDDEWARVKDFFSTRQGGGLWENFSRRWQGTASQGAESARTDLGLDSRPIVLLPTNVLGDSLTLGRQIFSESMTEWLVRTINYFWQRSDMQFVIRVHPGESIGWGPSVYDILNEKFHDFPENIHLLPAGAKVNTYDLVKTADLGLVFTTTVGMEMAMSGLPVVVTGQTHYRNKGFTLDADTWESYFGLLDRVLDSPEKARPSREQVEAAWTYAYRFFFEYPRPFPWHVQHFWSDVEKWPLERVFSEEGMAMFGETLRNFAGDPIDWRPVMSAQ